MSKRKTIGDLLFAKKHGSLMEMPYNVYDYSTRSYFPNTNATLTRSKSLMWLLSLNDIISLFVEGQRPRTYISFVNSDDRWLFSYQPNLLHWKHICDQWLVINLEYFDFDSLHELFDPKEIE